jgi:ubiquinone/menaquinone biosynthesis C-methylase UbiE
VGVVTALDSDSTAKIIQDFYDEVASEYDEELDLWSTHYHKSTSAFLRTLLRGMFPEAALDVGVGTGNHVIMYATSGATVVGVDRSRGMLRVSSYKASQLNLSPRFVQADAERLPFDDGAFDFVACCGSVLNYCLRPAAAVGELVRVLREGGIIVVGFDQSSSLDSLWVLADALTGHRLGYGINISDAVRWWRKDAPMTRYPYFNAAGRLVYAPERFLSQSAVTKMLREQGVKIRLSYGIHILSSAIPFTVISNPHSRHWTQVIGRHLCGADSTLRKLGALNRYGYHVLIQGTKF